VSHCSHTHTHTHARTRTRTRTHTHTHTHTRTRTRTRTHLACHCLLEVSCARWVAVCRLPASQGVNRSFNNVRRRRIVCVTLVGGCGGGHIGCDVVPKREMVRKCEVLCTCTGRVTGQCDPWLADTGCIQGWPTVHIHSHAAVCKCAEGTEAATGSGHTHRCTASLVQHCITKTCTACQHVPSPGCPISK
jgi:hypothetical protein